ncbi:heparinase II/III domain-containing protein [Aquimarina muelleri]|uniref:heparinase II/III domain-containing protein n=1 Tax=Aquimarina muelleri TaxID=279356 RepID=UPI003F68377D
MDRSKLTLLIHTIKHLKFKQVYYQVFYKIRNKFFKRSYAKKLVKEIQPLSWKDSFFYPNSFTKETEFTFLNYTYQFKDDINWNYAIYGKLWTYNLNYFDFLNQEEITINEGLTLIKDYIRNEDNLKDGKEPYPISLRGINWIKFLSRYKISDIEIDQTLYNHYQILINHLEYHLLGNHLLENGYSLLFGAYYFKDEELYSKAIQILKEELKEQILKDGAHFELSPMYHQILSHRLLDSISLIKNNSWKKDVLITFLEEKAIVMLSWLTEVTYTNGDIPMVNDSTYNIAPQSKSLFQYAKEIGLIWEKIELNDSGYRMFSKKNYELFIDIGDVGPKYQPGHAHSDTFSFELYVKDKPIIVDPGISTYEKNELRLKERSTESHNTVKIGNQQQTQVWDGFRVAKRAKIIDIQEQKDFIEATHDGYKNLNLLHTRKFYAEDSTITIKDILSKKSEKEQIAFFHFHPDVKEIQILKDEAYLSNENIRITFGKEVEKIEEESYEYAFGFNKRKSAKKIKVFFNTRLSTTINL